MDDDCANVSLDGIAQKAQWARKPESVAIDLNFTLRSL